MRLFTVLFAFYLAILACLPCADKAPVDRDSARTYVTSHESDAAHTRADWCTPLCQCHCCAGTSMPTALRIALAAPSRAFYDSGRYARLQPPAARHMPGSIWQPPQA
ncbi:DUF6660 family protein [Hymenobacter humi]|uniref:DUF6660 family protein n=1 Tax=Hymenobacter humi TaxID=1411620 RepID=A0ABW2UCX8_9BACT